MLLLTIQSFASSVIPDTFVNLKERIPSLQLDMRYAGSHNFVGRPIIGYQAPKAFATEAAAVALENVQNELAQYGLGIRIYDAYRPQKAVDDFVDWAKDLHDQRMKDEFYPDVNKEDLFRDGYIAEKSGHSRESTLDLTLIDLKTGEALDMGSYFDFFGEISWPSSEAVSADQMAHRVLLEMVMRRNGFVPYPYEWWHFTLADETFPDVYFDFDIQ